MILDAQFDQNQVQIEVLIKEILDRGLRLSSLTERKSL